MQYLDEERRLVALAAMAFAGLVRCIGFQQQLFDRQVRDDAPQALRPRVGDGATDADAETESVQFSCLFGAPGKTVHHAAQWLAESTQRKDHVFERTARVQHQRQVETMREFEVPQQQARLPAAIEAGVEMVQAAFAHGSSGVCPQPALQQAEIAVLVLCEVTRVQSVRGMQAGFDFAQGVQLRPSPGGHRGNQHLRHVGCPGVLQHPRTIGIEFRCIEVRVAVEQGNCRGREGFSHGSRLERNMNRISSVDASFIVELLESYCQQGHWGRETKMNHKSGLKQTLLVSTALVAAMALAGCGKGNPQAQATPANLTMATSAATATLPPGEPGANGAQAPGAAPQGAQGAGAQPQFAQVVAVQPITESATTSKPRQVCRDEQVAEPEPYKDKHQIGGAVVGGLVGALAGNQVGGGKGKTLATVAGAAGGAFAGHEIQKNHQENNATRMETRNVCHTVTDKTTSTKTVGYDVTYTLNGQAGHIRMNRNPGVGTGLPVQNGVVVASGSQGGNNNQ